MTTDSFPSLSPANLATTCGGATSVTGEIIQRILPVAARFGQKHVIERFGPNRYIAKLGRESIITDARGIDRMRIATH